MVNKVWSFFIVIGIVFCIITNRVDLINKTILKSVEDSLNIILKIFPVLALWLGIMNIAKISGLLKKISYLIEPVLKKIFPEIPRGHESISLIASNIVINIFGLGNAATPFGIKAMKSLQEINKNKEVASKSMITFLVLNTSGLTIVPTTIISLKMLYGSNNPTNIVLPCFIATLCSTIGGLLMDRVLSRKKGKY